MDMSVVRVKPDISAGPADTGAVAVVEVVVGGCSDGKGLNLTEPAVDGRELDPDEDEGRNRRAAGL